jgi:hypothetical protein
MFDILGLMARVTDESVIPEFQAVIGQLRSALGRLEPRYLSSAETVQLMQLFTEAERLAAAGRTLVSRQVERSGAWRTEGHRTAAHWVAATTGVSVGQAVGTLETARCLERLPATTEAFASGDLSEAQVREVASAAAASPEAESELLDAAQTESVASLRDRCRRVRAAATDETQAYERIRRSRYLRHWTDPEGALRLEARLTPDDGARVLAGIEPHRQRIFAEARAAGRRERSEAYAADALVVLAGGNARSARGPSAVVHVRVDRSALIRGHAVRGEVCEIPGVGPIPVATARRLASDAILKAFVTDGADVTAVAHVGRTIPARLRTALEARDPTCVVPGCGARQGLEIDHRIPFAEGGPTSLDNLARLCHWHHYLKSHHRYRLGGTPGKWTWTGPDPPSG